ncbi:hypothetical protein A5692_23495 [Mycobacterium sp. E342]|uniref:hypothetical protein n=1 Tax=Mycobacterium sp. E342 TaxID=1834147 RepID=UPI0007FC1FD0|nr:hypothetical protein [Mycobacterium sp. E342]OBH28117.1 hypothetical protein A5692_23495 [Mycobacterium sp. E342]
MDDDLPRPARVAISVVSPEGELVEIAFIFTNIVRRDTADFRQELENLVNSLAESASDTKPFITEQETPYPGGGLAQYGIHFLVGLPMALAGAGIYDLLKNLSNRFSTGGSTPAREQLLMENANPMALGAIEQAFGVTRDDLRPVITDVQGEHAKLVYQAKDGSTFTVNMEMTDKCAVTGITKSWPQTESGGES